MTLGSYRSSLGLVCKLGVLFSFDLIAFHRGLKEYPRHNPQRGPNQGELLVLSPSHVEVQYRFMGKRVSPQPGEFISWCPLCVVPLLYDLGQVSSPLWSVCPFAQAQQQRTRDGWGQRGTSTCAMSPGASARQDGQTLFLGAWMSLTE